MAVFKFSLLLFLPHPLPTVRSGKKRLHFAIKAGYHHDSPVAPFDLQLPKQSKIFTTKYLHLPSEFQLTRKMAQKILASHHVQ